MIAADIMIHPVLAIDPDTPLLQAIRLMTEHKVSGLPVVGRDGQLLGILTEGDLMRRVETGTEGKPPGWLSRLLRPGREAGQYVTTHGRRVGEVMTSAVFSVGPDTPLADVVTMMLRHRVKRLPVVHHGRLLGIVSRADLVRRVGQLLDAAPVSADDATIRRTILDTMARERWAPRTMLDITVKDAVVQLDGCVFDIRERDALGVLAENVPGVTRVENRIVCVEPYAGTVTFDPAAPM
jgi:CBS domain-containing protein